MACKYIYEGITYQSKEDFIDKVIGNKMLAVGKSSFEQLTEAEEIEYDDLKHKFNHPGDGNDGVWSRKDEERFNYLQSKLTQDRSNVIKQNQFLHLLSRDNNWVTFFVKSIIQDSAKKGYEKVLFPSGDTASKIEGHSTLEEFKKQKEDRIKELEEEIKNLSKTRKELQDKIGIAENKLNNNNLTEDEIEQQLYWIKQYEDSLERITFSTFNNEINQLKQELERVETEGFGALKPIFKFYEENITNILKKNYKVNKITDEYGNTWNEIDLSKVETENIQFQKKEKNTEQKLEKLPSKLKVVQEFYKRRLNTLFKELEKLEKDSPKYQEKLKEINSLKNKLEKAVEERSNDKFVELGTQTLDKVDEYIKDLEEGKDTGYRNLNYTKDTIDTFGEIKGLADRVLDLKERLKKVLEKFELERINSHRPKDKQLTIDKVNSQDSDIDTITKGTGSLSDLSNYRASTIGYEITNRQNKISKQNKNLYNELSEQLNKLEKYAKKNGASLEKIYSKLIIKTPDGKLRTISETEGLSSEEIEFLNYFQSKITMFQSVLPIGTDKFFLPPIPKKGLTWEKIKNRYKGIRVKEEANTEDIYADIVPLNFIKEIPNDKRSLDLAEILYTFGSYSNNFKEMSEVLPIVRILQEGIKETEFRKINNPNKAIKGENSNLYKMVDDVINMQVKGNMKLAQGITTSETTDENGNIVQEYIKLDQIADDFLSWNSLVRIGAAPITAASNVVFGDISDFIEGVGGRFYTVGQLYRAKMIYYSQTLKKDSMLNTLIEELGILQELDDYMYSEEVKRTGKLRGLKGDKLQEYMYSMQKAGEKKVQSQVMLGIMMKDGYIGKDNKLTNKYKNASEEEKQTLINKILRVNQMIHGRYTTREAATWYQHVWFRMISQFRKWIPAAYEARFAKYNEYDVRLQTDFEGRYRTFNRLVLKNWKNPKEAFENVLLTLFNNQKALESGKMTELEVSNMRKNMIEFTLVLGITALVMGLKGGADKDKKKLFWYKTTMSLLNRAAGDIEFFMPAVQVLKGEKVSNIDLVKNAVPSTKILEDLTLATQYVIQGLYSNQWTFKKGSHKGQIKPLVKLYQVTPLAKSASDIYRLFDKVDLEELR